MEATDFKRERYLLCHVCKVQYPVESVAMLCCQNEKTWEEDEEWNYLLLDGDFIRCNI